MLPDERTLAEATAFYQSKGWDGAEYVGLYRGCPVYAALNIKDNGGGTGLPSLVMALSYGNLHELNGREVMDVMNLTMLRFHTMN